MQRDVALDADGNPLPDDTESIDGDVALEAGDLGERERLTSNVDDEADDEVRQDGVRSHYSDRSRR